MTWYQIKLPGGASPKGESETFRDLRRELAPWNPHARGVLVAGALIGVRHKGGVVWLRRAGRTGPLLVTVRRTTDRLAAMYVSLDHKKSRVMGHPMRRRAGEGAGDIGP